MTGADSHLPAWLATVPPDAQATGVLLFTFVNEDVAAVGSALLHHTGALSWLAAFGAAMLGIWLGDAGLYWLARGFGRPLLQYGWAQRRFDAEKIARAETWFARRGVWVLVSSRLIPGTRLPTYMAAGFLRMPFGKFLAVTGAAVLVWTLAVFALVGWLGAGVLEVLERWKVGGFAIAGAAVLCVVLLQLVVKLFDAQARRRLGAAVQRWTRWEFWPAWLFYPPVAVYCLWLMLRHRDVTLPTLANPGIFSGGLVGESKLATLRELAVKFPEFTAAAHEIPAGDQAPRLSRLQELLVGTNCPGPSETRLTFPFILKPDVGQRGVGVKLIRSWQQAEDYLHQTWAPLVAQAYAPGPHELGVFYYRFPHEPHGRIFAITEKLFPTLTGDGVSTVEELIWRDPRARIIAAKYLARLGARAGEVPPAGETLRLVEAGNHAQGCIFQDGARLWSPELEMQVDHISRGLTGFFIGRYDLRYSNEADLRAGRSFQIIELNGAASEATNIYDARNSLWSAYRRLFQQWELVFAIGAANRVRGLRPTPVREVWRAWRAFNRIAQTYPAAD
jgi:membrane protein DedA with SNARE-associated domain